MRISSNNFTVKQIGPFWRVVGPGGKLLDGRYRLKQQALQALKSEVTKLLEETKYGFLKDTSEDIDQVLTKLKDSINGKETPSIPHSEDGERTNHSKGYGEGHENGQKDAKENEGQKAKKVGRKPKLSPTLQSTLRRHNI